jgi:hypothetical protein
VPRAADASPDAFVFGEAPDAAFAYTTASRRARADWRAAGLTAITLHECRHSCISTWIMAGVNLKTASGMAGHASIAITLDRYGDLLPEEEAKQRVADYLAWGPFGNHLATVSTPATDDGEQRFWLYQWAIGSGGQRRRSAGCSTCSP